MNVGAKLALKLTLASSKAQDVRLSATVSRRELRPALTRSAMDGIFG
jgi:hypothetical protein